MHKALGIAMIFLSLGVFLYKTVEEKRRESLNLKEFSKALAHLKNELKYSMPELSYLLKVMQEKTSGEVSYIFKEMEDKVRQESSVDFSIAFKSATDGKTLFSKEATDEIFNFCKDFGKKTVDIELEKIERLENRLDELIKEESEKFIKDKKLIYTLGISIGAVIVILGI